ncbi:type IV secretory system conjugative DNA transfer family protein [Ferruginibacter sp. HRS2-29]|uniref:type IV secretory system conjugative DNA transfer family protein n=1 Tax=Ferruginibacter sp. HRS2-29 TaxID=2487334 RepID=UPI0020CBBBFF|nr:TraM recognition domain-containing protein [Ferruginibacter sp. HRS2-29]MCP9749996.1 hypothetical protein [Ferruginibacter sp. HRS2-29]
MKQHLVTTLNAIIVEYNLDSTVVDFTGSNGVSQMKYSVRDSIAHTLILGQTGSGKTSGSARFFSLKYLSMGYAGIVLTTKPDDKKQFIEYCKIVNRLDDLIVIGVGEKNYFNFLEYESTDKTNVKSYTSNVLEILKTAFQASEEQNESYSDDPFWVSSRNMLVYNVLELCLLAYEKVSIKNIYDIVTSIPSSENTTPPDKKITGSFAHAVETARVKVNSQVETFLKQLDTDQRKALNEEHLMEAAILEAIQDAKRLKAVDRFFIQQYRDLSSKTRSIIDLSVSGFLFNLMQEPIYSLLCGHSSTVTPEDCLNNGKIVLIDLPVKLYDKAGRDAQILFKYCFQRAFEKRDVQQKSRPVFIIADEAQLFLHPKDADFQSTARSSHVAILYITQNLASFYSSMGGAKYKEKVDYLLGNFNTIIFHANTHQETNKYASELLGYEEMVEESHSENYSNNFSFGKSESKKLKPRVRPEEFVKLKSGTFENNYLVEAYMHIQSKPFSNGLHFKKVTFHQNWMPNI